MDNFKIITDSTADLPKSYYEDNNIGLMHLTCLFEGETYGKDKELDIKDFYARVRNGSMPTTSQVNPEEAKQALIEFGEENKNLLYLAFSSGLSGTYQSGCIAVEELKEERPDLNIIIIDTLCASMGEGLFVDKAVDMLKEGVSMEDTAKYLKDHVLNLVHVFTVDDLNHLYRGGRVSKATAIIGTMVGIKPLLHVDNEGHLIKVGTARGRKKSLMGLVDMMEERIGSYKGKNDKVFISHGDCEEDALIVQEEVKKRFGCDSFLISYIGPVVGAHSGPGTVALFFWGDER